MKEVISIIVSAYNTSLYIEKCLDSLIHQSYTALEIIVVDDGSLDDTRKIIENFARRDKRIVVLVNEKNMGLSYSRNKGLSHATGTYVGFIDSDDYVDTNYYEALHEKMVAEKSEIAVCDMKSYYENTGASVVTLGCDASYHGALSFIHTGLAASACNKLFLRSIFPKEPFATGKINEDVAVILPLLAHHTHISYVPNVYYYYVQRESSIQNSTFSMKRFDIFFGVEKTLEKIQGCEQFDAIRDALIFQQIILLFLYEFPKLKKENRRMYLRQFYRFSKTYSLTKNPYYHAFLDKTGSKTGLFYRILLFLECHRCFGLVSFLISFYQFFKKKFQTVVMSEVTLDDLERMAVEHVKLPNSEVSISVVIPNYNYKRFLGSRLESILSQRIRVSEIIILDDYSQDGSQEYIDEVVRRLSSYIPVRSIYNKRNSGSAFAQWEKGFSLCKGDYVWICEADDYATNDLLEHLVKPILREDNVVISYCDTAMIDVSGNLLVSSVVGDIDFQKSGHWNHDYVTQGIEEIESYAYLNCTIANVSSALIKRGDYSSYFSLSSKYKQAGDWLFYVNIMQHGKVAYCKRVCNYYRIHGNNVTSVTKKQAYLDEVKQVHAYIMKHFSLTEEQKQTIEKRYQYLKEVWNLDSN